MTVPRAVFTGRIELPQVGIVLDPAIEFSCGCMVGHNETRTNVGPAIVPCKDPACPTRIVFDQEVHSAGLATIMATSARDVDDVNERRGRAP